MHTEHSGREMTVDEMTAVAGGTIDLTPWGTPIIIKVPPQPDGGGGTVDIKPW